MLITTGTERLELVTSAAATLDVHATYIDTSGVTITPGRNNAAIATAATTLVVPTPPANTQRNIKTLHCRNKGASTSDVMVQINDGTTLLPIYNVPALKPGEMLQLVDLGGLAVARI